MHAWAAFLIFVTMLGFSACKKKADPSDQKGAGTSASKAAEAKKDAVPAAAASKVPARFGGTVLSVGSHAVELMFHVDGTVAGRVMDSSGKQEPKAKLSIVVLTRDGSRPKLVLEPSGGEGLLSSESPKKLKAGPVEIELELEGKVARASVPEVVISRRPAVGGSVLVAGPYSAELRIGSDGEVRAQIRQSSGVRVRGKTPASFVAKLSAEGGTVEVPLEYDAPSGSFSGKSKEPTKVVAGPVELVTTRDKTTQVGRLERIAPLAKPRHKGEMMALGEYSAELVAEAGELRLFLYDAAGEALSDGKFEVELGVGVGGKRTEALTWNAQAGCYTAKLEGRDLSVRPLSVSVKTAEKTHRGSTSSLRALAHISGNALPGGDERARAPRRDEKPKPAAADSKPAVVKSTSQAAGAAEVSDKASLGTGAETP